MSSSAMWSLIELSGFFVLALGLGLYQLWALKKLEILRRKQATESGDRSSTA
jgi:hypothetical protein